MTDNELTPNTSHHRLIFWDILRDKRSRSVGLWVAVILILGSTFYHFAEGWSWVDSLYFSFISLATVGYGDFVPTSDLSKIFTIFYIANGLGVLVVFVDIYASLRLGRPMSAVERRPPSSTISL